MSGREVLRWVYVRDACEEAGVSCPEPTSGWEAEVPDDIARAALTTEVIRYSEALQELHAFRDLIQRNARTIRASLDALVPVLDALMEPAQDALFDDGDES